MEKKITKNGNFILISHWVFFPLSLGLKHVSDDQKTHKNTSLRSQSAPIKTKTPERVTSPKAAPAIKAPLLELEGKKWRVVRVPTSRNNCLLCVCLFIFFPWNSLSSWLRGFISAVLGDCRRILSRNTTWWSRRRSSNRLSTYLAATAAPCRLRAKSTPSL